MSLIQSLRSRGVWKWERSVSLKLGKLGKHCSWQELDHSSWCDRIWRPLLHALLFLKINFHTQRHSYDWTSTWMGQVECGASGSGAERCVSVRRMVFTGQLPQYLCATVVAAMASRKLVSACLSRTDLGEKKKSNSNVSPKYTRAQFWKEWYICIYIYL